MYLKAIYNSSNFFDIFRLKSWNKKFLLDRPGFFAPIGTMIFCGSQGTGKTLSAVCYIYNVLKDFPKSILVTNVSITDYPFNTYYATDKDGVLFLYDLLTRKALNVSIDFDDNRYFYRDDGKVICIEYDGLDCLKHICNGYMGVLYLIDELHLELNSLESKNIDIDVMTEISQQRKQRKHIVGTSQVYMRLAKPLREQIFDIVLCSKYFGFLQYNKLIDGEKSKEENGKLNAFIVKMSFWIHKPVYYLRYDTFAKMQRYNKEWHGHKREVPVVFNSTTFRGDKK